MDQSLFGTDNLIEKLRVLFYQHLKLFLPTIYQNLQTKINECKQVLNDLGPDMSSDNNMMMNINSLINQFSDRLEHMFGGKLVEHNEELNILRQIKLKYNELLQNFTPHNYKPSDNIDVKNIV